MKDITDNTDLTEIINDLVSKFNIEQIYLNTYDQESTVSKLIILVSESYVKTMSALVQQIIAVKDENMECFVTCFTVFQARDKINKGNLFLFTSCQPHNLIYKNDNSVFAPITTAMDIATCKELALAQYDREKQKIDEFKDGYYYFKGRQQLGTASFMLHQSMELTYRNLELFLGGQDRITHSIKVHDSYLEKNRNTYMDVFNEELDEDLHLLQVLEVVYRETRYENDFSIDIETLMKLEHKMEMLHCSAAHIFEHNIKAFEQQYNDIAKKELKMNCLPEKIACLNSNIHKNFNEALEYLKSNIPVPIAIYLFGNRQQYISFDSANVEQNLDITNHIFYLLVVSETGIREKLSNLPDLINKDFGIPFFILGYTKNQIKWRLKKNNSFFHQVLLRKGALLHSEIDIYDWRFHQSKGISTKVEIDKRLGNWHVRQQNANGFFSGGYCIHKNEEVGVKVLLLNKAIEQACLGLLEAFHGLTPYYNSLNHLFNLCCGLWYFPYEIFPRFTKEDNYLLKELIHASTNVLYKGMSDIKWENAILLEDRCEKFVETTNKLVRKTFAIEDDED